MRRDYFTCVFLALIAGALAFLCFCPVYFDYLGIIPRDFGLFETILSWTYAVFFLLALPLYAGYARKYWISVGLACYGFLAYVPAILYPAEEKLVGENADLISVGTAAFLRGIYCMVNAPFAAISDVMGSEKALVLSKLILPVAIAIPLLIKLIRFYRNAYAQERLDPAAVMSQEVKTKTRKPAKPEVLGTVITAPVNAASPEEVSKKATEQAVKAQSETVVAPPVRPEVSAPPVKPEVSAPPVKPEVSAPPKKERVEAPEEKILLDAPKSPYDDDGVIRL